MTRFNGFLSTEVLSTINSNVPKCLFMTHCVKCIQQLQSTINDDVTQSTIHSQLVSWHDIAWMELVPQGAYPYQSALFSALCLPLRLQVNAQQLFYSQKDSRVWSWAATDKTWKFDCFIRTRSSFFLPAVEDPYVTHNAKPTHSHSLGSAFFLKFAHVQLLSQATERLLMAFGK